MQREDITLEYFKKNQRLHKVKVLYKPYNGGISKKSINGYWRMLAQVIDTKTNVQSDIVIFAARDMPVYNEIKIKVESGSFKVDFINKNKQWYIIKNYFVTGTSVIVDTKEYYEFYPPHLIKDSISIFLWGYQIGKDHDYTIDTTLRTLRYTDGTGNEPTSRYF